MTYGMTCLNDSGELTMSSDCFSLCYLGKATFVSSTDYSGTSSSSNVGGSVWTFTWPGPIVCAIGLKGGQIGARITSVTRSSTSSSTWTINVVDFSTTPTGPSGDTSGYYAQRTDSDIYVFGFPIAANLPAYGFAMYNASGVLSCDLSKPLLSINTRVALAVDVMSQTIPSFTKPAVIGYPDGFVTTSTGTGFYRNTLSLGCWRWVNDGNLYRIDVASARSIDDAPISGTNRHLTSNGILIEANGLT